MSMGSKHWVATLAIIAALGGCVSAPNDVRQGVGFGDYEAYLRAEEARRAALRQPPAPIALPQQSAPAMAQSSDPLIARAQAALDANAVQSTPLPAPAPAATAALPAPASLPAPLPSAPRNAGGLSDEQDFDAVAARETIESDAERRARMQSQMVIVQPVPVPDRPADSGPSVLNYAVATTHPVGQRVYPRSPLGRGRHAENCAAYRSADLAQEDFLTRGGPNRDPLALDPDGDGYACAWDPAPLRALAASAGQ